MTLRVQCLTIDAIDPPALGRWWADLLGWRVTFNEDPEVVIEPPVGSPEDGVVPDLLFLRSSDTKATKNRIHLDLRPDDQEAEVARAIGLGARRVDIGQDATVSWVVLADPEGNEFCILRPLTAAELTSLPGATDRVATP